MESLNSKSLLLKNVTLIHQGHELNGKKVDILVEKGIIKKIAEEIKEKAENTIDEKNLHVSIGWFDMMASMCDPGYEHKETIESGINAAIAGGFTGVALLPETNPVASSKSQISYIKNKSAQNGYELIPLGSISQNFDGENLAEFYDMYQSGARGFTDGFRNLNSALLSRALLYSKNSGGLILSFPNDKSLSKGGIMHEGIESTKLGLKGIPALAESLQVARDIELAIFNDSPLHFTNISTSESVQLIQNAKKAKHKITAQVSSLHLLLNDACMKEFESNNKVLPPFRTKEHIESLIDGINNNTIDVIVSAHIPHDIESKKVELAHAEFGAINLETSFAAARTATNGKVKIDLLIEKMSKSPREILGLEIPEIKEGAKANLTLFDPDKKWIYETKNGKSKSQNSPLNGMELTGKVFGVIF